MQPIYTIQNTACAFQLNWSVSLFSRQELPLILDIDELKSATESDGVRILEFCQPKPDVGQFLVSSTPEVSPSNIVRSVKGRWQHQVKASMPKAFRRNYQICSVGEANSHVLDQYVARQTSRHAMVDPRVQDLLESLQFFDATVDLGRALTGHHGQFVHSLQVVLENTEGWNDTRADVLENSREMIIRTAEKKQWRLSRIGLLSNHFHILLGASVTESPASVALSLMNNLAYAQGMKRVLRFGYYVGTFGRYDRGAIRRLQ